MLQFQTRRYLVYLVSEYTEQLTQLPFTGRVSGKQTANRSNTWLYRERGKGKGGRWGRALPRLKMSAEDPRICRRERVPSSNMSSRSVDVTPPAPWKRRAVARSNRGGGPAPLPRVTSGGAAAILSVASGSRALPKCSSPWLPGGRFFPSALPAGGQAGALGERERPPQASPSLLPGSPRPLSRAAALSASPYH